MNRWRMYFQLLVMFCAWLNAVVAGAERHPVLAWTWVVVGLYALSWALHEWKEGSKAE